MDDPRWEKARELFAAALERPAGERGAFLRDACAGDDALRAEVEGLLAADESGHSLLDAGAADAGLMDLVPPAVPLEDTVVGKRIGPWRILQPIGSGGMGAVYLARRDDGEYRQTAALKLIRRGMNSAEIVARFRAERQILARLDHPGIARLLDGGISEDGRPWFTMEYVDGLPIDRYCDEHRLPLEERVRLFADACDAVRYAQSHLVVHRDLKPRNILVTADGKVKLLDFGIAKLLDPDDAGDAVTRTGHRPMTPGYAAPEQVRGQAVTTATDVYALGVLLYELLTGRRPYAPADDTPASLERAILETDPERPSDVVAPRPARKKLAGDLDNVCLMALRKEPERRYGSAEQLLADIRNWRAGRPVMARPDTVGYRAAKFVQRNRVAAAAAGGALVAVVALVSFYTTQLARERDRARVEAAKAKSVVEFLTGLFEVVDPSQSLGETITARELLDRGARRIDAELTDQPVVQATMEDVVGSVYHALGLYADADSLLGRALRIRERLYPGDHEELAESLAHVGALRRTGGDYDEAEALARRALEMNRRLHPRDSDVVADNLRDLAWVLGEKGEAEEAEGLLREALDIWTRLHGPEDARLGAALNDLGLLASERRDYDEAERLYRRAVAIQRKAARGPNPELASTLYNLGQLQSATGDLGAAEMTLVEVLETDRTIWGEEHPQVAYDVAAIAKLEKQRFAFLESEAHFREALAMRRRFHGDEHPDVAHSLADLAEVLVAEGRPDEAEPLLRESLAMHRRLHGDEHPVVAMRWNALARLEYDRRAYAKSVEHARAAYELNRKVWGPRHGAVAESGLYLARSLAAVKRFDEALAIQREALEIEREAGGEDSRPFLLQSNGLAQVLAAAGRVEEAEAAYRAVLERGLPQFGEDNPLVTDARIGLGRLLCRRGACDEGAALLEAAVTTRRARLPAGHPGILRAEEELAAGREACAGGA